MTVRSKPSPRALACCAPLLALACHPEAPATVAAPSAESERRAGVLQLTDAFRSWSVDAELLTVGREIRPGFLSAPPSSQRSELHIPGADTRLHLAYALLERPEPEEACEGGTTFRAVLVDEADEATILTEQSESWPTGWLDRWIELGDWAGQRVSLELQIEERPGCSGSVGAWGDLQLHTPPPTEQRPPDIWVLVVDTLRADHVGYAGVVEVSTPHIDQLASRSLRFTDALAPGPWTRVSVLSMMAGEYISAGEPACRFEDRCTQGGLPTIQELLRAHDYRTVGITCNAMLSAGEEFHRGFDVFMNTEDHIVATELERLLPEDDRDQPTFVYLQLMSPHEPYCFHHGISERHLEREGLSFGEGCFGFEPSRDDPGFDPSEQDVRLARALYQGEVEWTDRAVGEILALYEQRAHTEQRWLFFTADHGEEFMEHGSVYHGHTLYQEQLQVPLLIQAPPAAAGVGAPRNLDAPVSLVDIAHTVAELADLPPLSTRGGRSLLGVMESRESLDERVRLASGVHEGPGLGAWIARGDKWIWTIEDADGAVPPPQRYALGEDPGEQRNLVEDTPSVAPGRSPWAGYDRLVSTGTALLDITTAPSHAGPLRLSLGHEGGLSLLAQAPSEPPLALRCQAEACEIEIPAGSAVTLQLSGLHERGEPVRVRVFQGETPVPLDRIDGPAGARVASDGALLITPWLEAQVTSSSDEPALGLQWRTDGSIGPAGLGRTDEFTHQLRALGYLE